MLRSWAAALILFLPGWAGAYVTSATLEYSTDDQVGFYLNGVTLLARSDYHPFDVALLSTSDGTLPIHLFNANGDNVLGAENFDTEGGHMGLAYRLTVHHSDGDPVVVWSEPGATKFLHLKKIETSPLGWMKPGFDDSAWKEAIAGFLSADSQYVTWPKIVDAAFEGFLGAGGYVPYVCHSPTGLAGNGDHNLLRSHFRFPNTPEKIKVVASPPSLKKGERSAIRLIPGKDAAYYPRFQILAKVPQGMRVDGLSQGGYLDAKTGYAVWDFGADQTRVTYTKLGLNAVVSAPGWALPQKMLGIEKPGKTQRQLNVPDHIYNDGAKFFPANPGWFRVRAPGPADNVRPVILGVLFRGQAKGGGRDNYTKPENDPVMFNYSLDGGLKGALKEDKRFTYSTISDRWIEAWYDASEDRAWTWDDFKNLQVKLESRQMRSRDQVSMASCTVIIKSYDPAGPSPYFYAAVDDPACRAVRLDTGIRMPGSGLLSSDPVKLLLNAGLCPPTPVPTYTPRPTSTPQVAVAPTPEPTRPPMATAEPTPMMSAGAIVKLGCLEDSPEPFKRGGTFVYFCVDKESEVELIVYSGSTGAKVRTLKGGTQRPGKHDIFFNGMDEQGKTLAPGRYIYEVRAVSEGRVDSRNSQFNRVKDR